MFHRAVNIVNIISVAVCINFFSLHGKPYSSTFKFFLTRSCN